MKPFFLLLPLLLLVEKMYKSIEASDSYQYELTVNSLTDKVEQFDLLIVGQMQGSNEDKTPYRSEMKNLKTPYQLKLSTGNYSIRIENKTSEAALICKVQGIKNGVKMGSAAGEGKKVSLQAGPGGSYSANP